MIAYDAPGLVDSLITQFKSRLDRLPITSAFYVELKKAHDFLKNYAKHLRVIYEVKEWVTGNVLVNAKGDEIKELMIEIIVFSRTQLEEITELKAVIKRQEIEIKKLQNNQKPFFME